MSHPSSAINEMSRQIVEHEVPAHDAPDAVARAAEAMFQRLHELMATLVGAVGFGAIMTRAIHLTKPCPWLEQAEIQIGATLTIKGLSPADQDAASIRSCAVRLLGNVIALLGSLIGEDLTFRIVQRAWTDLPKPEPIGSEDS